MTGSLEGGRPGVAARLERGLPAARWIALIITLIAVDQGIKLYVFRTMALHENVSLPGRWVMLRLELNDGTALGFPFVNELDRYLRIDMFSCPRVFGPVFNFADMLLTIGGVLALVGLVRLRHWRLPSATSAACRF